MDSRIAWAEKLIEEGRYDEAEDILRDLTDPNAYQLARKLDALRPDDPPEQPRVRRQPEGMAKIFVFLFMIPIIALMIALTTNASPAAQAIILFGCAPLLVLGAFFLVPRLLNTEPFEEGDRDIRRSGMARIESIQHEYFPPDEDEHVEQAE